VIRIFSGKGLKGVFFLLADDMLPASYVLSGPELLFRL
jgi:hypothetical protein